MARVGESSASLVLAVYTQTRQSTEENQNGDVGQRWIHFVGKYVFIKSTIGKWGGIGYVVDS